MEGQIAPDKAAPALLLTFLVRAPHTPGAEAAVELSKQEEGVWGVLVVAVQVGLSPVQRQLPEQPIQAVVVVVHGFLMAVGGLVLQEAQASSSFDILTPLLLQQLPLAHRL